MSLLPLPLPLPLLPLLWSGVTLSDSRRVAVISKSAHFAVLPALSHKLTLVGHFDAIRKQNATHKKAKAHKHNAPAAAVAAAEGGVAVAARH
jgi:hypothetical protein